MSEQASPQVSPDGKFWWNGYKWQPVQAPVPAAPAKRSGGKGCLIIGGIVLAIVIIAAIASAATGGGGHQRKLNLDFDGLGTGDSAVGRDDGFRVTITNHGEAIENLALYVNSKDNWIDHHVVTSAGGCSENKDLGRFECGALAAGETRTIEIGGSPKEVGNFDYQVDFADSPSSGSLAFNDQGFGWSEIVRP